LQDELGVERANAIALGAITAMAQERGRELAQQMGRSDLEAFAQAMQGLFDQGDLDVQVVEETPSRFTFRITRCKFADMYRELGIPDLALLLSCARDFALCEGFNPRIKLSRPQTLVEGDTSCDFAYTLEPGPEEA
ncbi:MAG: L-2-amino-thiazoline-4-carboxylic acid hydrolase, partial [Dehalococcoidia bacterium]